MASKTWQTEMSLTDRLYVGMKMLVHVGTNAFTASTRHSRAYTSFKLRRISAYKAVSPDLQIQDVRQKAQALEEAAFQNASSKVRAHQFLKEPHRLLKLLSRNTTMTSGLNH